MPAKTTDPMPREIAVDTGIEVQRLHAGPEYSRLQYSEDLELQEFDNIPLYSDSQRKKWLRWMKFFLLGISALAVVGVAIVWGLPFLLDKVIIPLMEWEASTFSRPVLALVLIGSMAIFPILLIPSGPSMWLAGMVFGYGLGFLIIMAGTSIGMSLPFFIARWLFHARIQRWLERWPKRAALIRIADQGGWFYQYRVVTLIRVSPVPYAVFSYAVATTNAKFGPYISGSCTAMVPEAFVTIYSGRLLKTLADVKNARHHLTPFEIIYNVIGLCVAVGVTVAGTIYGRRALQELEIKEQAERTEGTEQIDSGNSKITDPVSVDLPLQSFVLEREHGNVYAHYPPTERSEPSMSSQLQNHVP